MFCMTVVIAANLTSNGTKQQFHDFLHEYLLIYKKYYV